MLEIHIPAIEVFNEQTSEFRSWKEQDLKLEHSLVSISKWESKWHKAFLGKNEKTREQTIDYIRFMTLTQNVDYDLYNYLPEKALKEINEYINDSMTATYFFDTNGNDNGAGGLSKNITSEEIYYWMISLNIPVEFQKWHINRLLTLIRVCNVKNTPPKKMSKSEIMRRNRALNEQRKLANHTTG